MAINDFGEKIGGARKDLWRERNLQIEDLLEMNDAERSNYVKKDTVWKKPNYQELVDSGIPVRVVYFMKKVRDATPVKPPVTLADTDLESIALKQENYVNFVSDLRDAVLGLRTEQDVLGFYKNFIEPNYVIEQPGNWRVDVVPEVKGCLDNKLFKAVRISSFYKYDREIKEKQFCYTEEEKYKIEEQQFKRGFFVFSYDKEKVSILKDAIGRTQIWVQDKAPLNVSAADANTSDWEQGKYFVVKSGAFLAKNLPSEEDAKALIQELFEKSRGEATLVVSKPGKKRKTNFVPKQLKAIKREGADFRRGKDATGDDYLEVFGFRGGEFGNWLSDNDRKASLNYGYDALMDLCDVLKIEPSDISLGGRLAIAFGSRGKGGALAHYEPMREVINLTKMKGAGSLAHEWAHALDDIFGKDLITKVRSEDNFMTHNTRDPGMPKSIVKLVDAMQYKEVANEEVLKRQEDSVRLHKDRCRREVNALFPLRTMTDEQKERLDKMVDSYIERSKGCQNEYYESVFGGTGNGNKAVDRLSAFRKELTGRGIAKDTRIDLCRYQNELRYRLERVGAKEKVKTDFYLNSIEFDKLHSKTDHGYWQSNIEMFARAFACYVSDKLAESKSQSDYLCGHSELAVSIRSNERTGALETIKAIPEGEERRVINECFDELIQELKEKGLLHEHTIDIERLAERKAKLDDVVKAAHAQRNSGIKFAANENVRGNGVRIVENKNGQLSFVL